MSWATSVGLNIPTRASDQGPPDPIECEYDLEGPLLVATIDGEYETEVLCHFMDGCDWNEMGRSSAIRYSAIEGKPVTIDWGWIWRLDGGEWMFAHKRELAEENACEAYMEGIEDDYHDI